MIVRLRKIFTCTCIAFFVLVVAGCGNKGDGSPEIARFRDNFLTRNQLKVHLPDGLNEEDSARLAKYYIDQWVREQAIAEAAMKQIPNLSKEIDQKVEEFRRTLLLQEYNKWVIANKLDRNVPDDSIRGFYDQEKENYIASENLFSYFYISTTEEGSNGISDLIKSEDPLKIRELSENIASTAIHYKLDSSFVDSYQIEQDRKGYLGSLENGDVGQLIRWSGVIQGQKRKYFFKMLDKVEKGDPLPFPLVKNEIRQTILNERKLRLINEEQERIYKEAISQSIIQTDLHGNQ